MPELIVDEPHEHPVWRVGYKPDPWAWVGWEWATDGRFHGRWDDRDGNFRTVYAGSTLLACLLELLADFRPDPQVAHALDDIVEEPDDAAMHPTVAAGELHPSWLEARAAGSGVLSGRFCAVTASDTLATLHPQFVGLALALGLKDFDAAALKDGRARRLTQALATHLYAATTLDGIRFASRHGDDLTLWAIFERPDDAEVSRCVRAGAPVELTRDHPDVIAALDTLGLRWSQ